MRGVKGRRMERDPLKQTSAERMSEKANLQRRSAMVTEYLCPVFSARMRARCLSAMDIRGPIPPELDITIGVKLPQSTLLCVLRIQLIGRLQIVCSIVVVSKGSSSLLESRKL